jgi:hypothetical protein
VWKRMMILRKRREDNILGLHLDQKGLHDDLSPIHINSIIYDLVESIVGPKIQSWPGPPSCKPALKFLYYATKSKINQ